MTGVQTCALPILLFGDLAKTNMEFAGWFPVSHNDELKDEHDSLFSLNDSRNRWFGYLIF